MRAFSMFLAAISIFSFNVFADEFADRQNLHWQRETQTRAIASERALAVGNALTLSQLKRFIRRHRGLANGTCEVMSAGMRPYSEGMVKFEVNGSPYEVRFSDLQPAGNYQMFGCRLDLNDGLDCKVGWDGGIAVGSNVRVSVTNFSCYDPQGNPRNFQVIYK